MRHLKRSVSVFLVLLLVLCIVPAAEAKTGTLTKNTGTRHQLCTSLSSQAQAYYTGSYTYDAVSQLSASTPTPKPGQDPALPGAVVLPRSGDYIARIDGGYTAEHMETVDGTECLRVDLYIDGVTAERKLSSISFKLAYDPAQLTYVKHKGMSGSMSAANPNVAGLFQYSFISTNGTLMNGKPLLTLYFRLADGLPSGTQIRFGFSEPVKADSVGANYTSQKRTVGVQLKPYVIDMLWGDANCDFEVTAADASLVLRSLVGLETLSGRGLSNAKVEGKPTLSVQDAVLILRKVVGLIAVFPAEG